MRTRYRVIIASIALAACNADRPSTTPMEASFSKGVSSPNTAVNLTASYSSTTPTFFSDGRVVSSVDHPFSVPAFPVMPGLWAQDCYASWTGDNGATSEFFCVTAVAIPNTYFAKCESRTATVDQALVKYDGVLAASVDAVPRVSYTQFSIAKSSGLVIGRVSADNVFAGNLNFRLLNALGARLPSLGAPIPVIGMPPLGVLARDKTTTDIPQPSGLLANLAQAQTLLGDGSVLTNANPAELLAVLKSQSLVDLVLTVSPVFNAAQHANHPACKGPDKTVTTEIPFSSTATYVATPSGNANLNFDDVTFLHFNANQSRTRASGSLISADGLWSIDLSQFDGAKRNIPRDLVSGTAVAGRACKTATPTVCTDVVLRGE